MSGLLSLAAERLAQFTRQFTTRLDGQEAQSSFRGDIARDEFFLPHLMGAQERALFQSSCSQKDEPDVRQD